MDDTMSNASVEERSDEYLLNIDHEESHHLKDNGVNSQNGKLVYYFGIIDVLQLYDCNKQSERMVKIFCKCKDPVHFLLLFLILFPPTQ